ncbi:hypothetical protein ACQEVG_20515 [Streptomyces sp. CA-135486]|uniref:hypothetical protein n=1 Tax=Streptomyces sp. CA-135486 TaxID=3240049 RepID=UPI003D939C11
MDPVSVALLGALAGGFGGEAGKRAWNSLTTLVRRPFANRSVSSGEPELTALAQAPGEVERAHALSTVLAVRSALDPDFGSALSSWAEQARLVQTGEGDVHNEISGGTQHAPVLQGRDFSGLNFTTSPPPPPKAGE